MLFNRTVQFKLIKDKDVENTVQKATNDILIVEPERMVVLAAQVLSLYMILDTFRKVAVIWAAK